MMIDDDHDTRRTNLHVEAMTAKAMQYVERGLAEKRARLDLRREEIESYSLDRALTALREHTVTRGSFEAEISQELARSHEVHTTNSLLVPLWGFRAMNATDGAAGGYLVDTGTAADSLAYLLRGRSVIASLPITTMPNLVGNVSVPVETAGPTVTTLSAEDSQITTSQGTLGSVALSPKLIGATTRLSHQFAIQAPGYVNGALLRSVGARLDELAIAGSGSNGEPLGLISQITGSVSGTSLTEAGVREYQTDIGDALGPDCGFVGNRAVASLLNGRQRFTGSDRTLWEGNLHQGQVGGWPAFSAPSLPAGHLLFGAWASFILASWGTALELSMNPYEDFKYGISAVRVIATFDVALTRPSAFSLSTAVT
jgi:HK97 family phage major capsid protein